VATAEATLWVPETRVSGMFAARSCARSIFERDRFERTF
jgi:hypothetical protein